MSNVPPVFGVLCVASYPVMASHLSVNSPMAQLARMYEAMERVGQEQKRIQILYKVKAQELKTAMKKR